MKLVIFPSIDEQRLDRVREVDGSVQVVNAADEVTARAEIVDADAFFGKLTPDLLRVSTRLRWVQAPTASLEHYLFPELVEHPAVLTNMRGLFSDVIANHVFGYILCFARNLHIYIRQQLEQSWAPVGGESARVGFATGPGQVTPIDLAHLHLADHALGIVGLGSIGREVARRANAFGMRVYAVDPDVSQVPAEVQQIWPPEQLDELLERSDFVVICAPHTPQTEALFDRRKLQAMRRSAYLINIGRGVIVRLADLHQALVAGEIAGAALDVFETEPLPADHPLWKLPNVLITPHVAGYSPRIAERHLQVLLENVRRFTRGEPLQNVVDKHRWY